MNRTPQEEKAALDKALDAFVNECRARLYEMVDRGNRGWDAPELAVMIGKDLANDAIDADEFGCVLHFPDIANRALMLWWQAWGRRRFDTGDVQ